MTSPSRIIPSSAMLESFNGVDPGTKDRENTRREEHASEAIEQPHGNERSLAHGAYFRGDGAAEEAVSSHGLDVHEAEGGVHKAIIFIFVQCGLLKGAIR